MAQVVLPEGLKVKYRHTRKYINSSTTLSPRGGLTQARVYGPDDTLLAVGHAICHPKDNYDKRIGRLISLGRALKDLSRDSVIEEDPA